MNSVELAGTSLVISSMSSFRVLSWLRRRAILDIPNERSSHVVPIPRGGGIAPALALVVAALLMGEQRLALVVLIYGGLGLLEDTVGVSTRRRLLVQLSAALILTPVLVGVISHSLVYGVVSLCVSVLWMAGFVNAFNFMDGINGISVAQASVAAVTWTIAGALNHVSVLTDGGLVLLGAALGFAPFNFPRARVFLGDAGSYAIGGWMAAMIVIGLRAGIRFDVMLAPVLIALADTTLTACRRARDGKSVGEAHRDHAYQRLVQLGWSHARTTITIMTPLFLCNLAGVFASNSHITTRVAIDTCALLLTATYVVSPGIVTRRRTL
jgi:UDP-GlcNAc:undecaprenyl-phosphate/decaprenyl-phosphate GlcNAc-1-phosphate transferase